MSRLLSRRRQFLCCPSLVPSVQWAVCLPSVQCAVCVSAVCLCAVRPVSCLWADRYFVICWPTVLALSMCWLFFRLYVKPVQYDACHACCICAICLMCCLRESHSWTDQFMWCLVFRLSCALSVCYLFMTTVHFLSVWTFCKLHVPTVPLAINPVYRPVMVNTVCYLYVCWLFLFCCCVCSDLHRVLFSGLSVQCHVMGTKGLYIVFCAFLPLCSLVSCPSHWVSVGRPFRVLSVSKSSLYCVCRFSVSIVPTVPCAVRSACCQYAVCPMCCLRLNYPRDVCAKRLFVVCVHTVL